MTTPYRTPASVDEAIFTTALNTHLPVLVLFGAAWSPLSNAALLLLATVGEACGARCSIRTVDIDAVPNLAKRYGIRSVPTFIVFRGGQRVAQYDGVPSEGALLHMIGG